MVSFLPPIGSYAFLATKNLELSVIMAAAAVTAATVMVAAKLFQHSCAVPRWWEPL